MALKGLTKKIMKDSQGAVAPTKRTTTKAGPPLARIYNGCYCSCVSDDDALTDAPRKAASQLLQQEISASNRSITQAVFLCSRSTTRGGLTSLSSFSDRTIGAVNQFSIRNIEIQRTASLHLQDTIYMLVLVIE